MKPLNLVRTRGNEGGPSSPSEGAGRSKRGARAARPLAPLLDAELGEARVRSVWRGVEGQLHPGRPRQAWAPWAALAAVGVMATVWWWPAPQPPCLLLEGGGVLAAEHAEREMSLTFTDGSRIELQRNAQIQTTRNDASRMELTLERGVARFSVTPGGPRHWRIECGVAQVEVVGTQFVLTRTDDGLGIRVEHGLVRVLATAGGSWALAAGEELWVPATIVEEAPSPPAVEAAILEHEASAEPHPPEVRSDSPASRHPVRSVVAPTASELLARADEARLSGRPRDAVAPLERLLQRYGTSLEAPLAAVMLARLYQDVVGSPRDAARVLERANAIGVPHSLAADVDGRLALAYLDLGDPRGIGLAQRYLEAHPEGARADLLRARLDR